MCQPILETHFLPRSSSEFTLCVFHNTSVLYAFLVNTHVFFQWFTTSASQREASGFETPGRLVPFCLEFTCFPCACVGFLSTPTSSPNLKKCMIN